MPVLYRRQSPNSPSTPLSNPASWLYEAFGAQTTSAGVSINEVTALNVAAWFQGVSIIAKAVGASGLKTYRRLEDGGRERARDQRIYHLLSLQPNPQMTAITYHETMTAHAVSRGNAYAEIEYNARGEIIALWPLPPHKSGVVRRDGIKYVWTEIPAGAALPRGLIVEENKAFLPPGKYVHIPGLSYDGLAGYNTTRLAKGALGLAKAQEEFNSRFIGRGATSALVLEVPGELNLSPAGVQRLKQSFESDAAGLSNSHRTVVLEEGIKPHQIGVSPEAAQFIESRQNQVLEIARVLDIPPYRMGADPQAQSYNAVEGHQIDLVQWTHRPWLIRFEQAYTLETMPDRHGEHGTRVYFCSFNLDSMLRADSKTRAETEQTYFQSGAAAPNEIRARNNWPRIDNPAADEPWFELNRVPLSRVGEVASVSLGRDGGVREVTFRGGTPSLETRQQRSAASRHRLQRAQIAILRRAAEHFVLREVRHLLRLIRKAFHSSDWKSVLLRGMEEFYSTFPESIRRELLPALLAYAELLAAEVGEELGRTIPFGEEMQSRVERFVEKYGESHVLGSRGQLEAIMRDASDDQVQGALTTRVEQWEERRPEKIARRESVRANGAFSKMAYLISGSVLTLRLVLTGSENCSFCRKVAARGPISIRGNFVEKGEEMDFENESEPSTARRSVPYPPLHDGCDCIVVSG